MEFNNTAFTISIDRAIAVREFYFNSKTFCYLSIYEDEIGDRIEALEANLSNIDVDKSNNIGNNWFTLLAKNMELTDVILHLSSENKVMVIRGAACNFPLYWRRGGKKFKISSSLPVSNDEVISKKGILSIIESLTYGGLIEPNVNTQSALKNWNRFRRGAITIINKNGHQEFQIVHTLNKNVQPVIKDKIAEDLRKAFESFSFSQRNVNFSILELSGGYDSTLAGLFAKHDESKMRGISITYPHYEFRHESKIQAAVAKMIGVERILLDGTKLGPFSKAKYIPKFYEPSASITGIAEVEAVVQEAIFHGASKIYVGHGGDSLFSSNLFENQFFSPIIEREFFAAEVWKNIQSDYRILEKSKWRMMNTGCFISDGIPDYYKKKDFGVLIRTPFTDSMVYKTALSWSEYCKKECMQPDKTIFNLAFGSSLPKELINRKGKVDYSGIWMRSYSQIANEICDSIEKQSDVLEKIGFSLDSIFKRIDDLENWKTTESNPIILAFSISKWLNSWNLENPEIY